MENVVLKEGKVIFDLHFFRLIFHFENILKLDEITSSLANYVDILTWK